MVGVTGPRPPGSSPGPSPDPIHGPIPGFGGSCPHPTHPPILGGGWSCPNITLGPIPRLGVSCPDPTPVSILGGASCPSTPGPIPRRGGNCCRIPSPGVTRGPTHGPFSGGAGGSCPGPSPRRGEGVRVSVPIVAGGCLAPIPPTLPSLEGGAPVLTSPPVPPPVGRVRSRSRSRSHPWSHSQRGAVGGAIGLLSLSQPPGGCPAALPALLPSHPAPVPVPPRRWGGPSPGRGAVLARSCPVPTPGRAARRRRSTRGAGDRGGTRGPGTEVGGRSEPRDGAASATRLNERHGATSPVSWGGTGGCVSRPRGTVCDSAGHGEVTPGVGGGHTGGTHNTGRGDKDTRRGGWHHAEWVTRVTQGPRAAQAGRGALQGQS